jgi:hypothetical protein
MTTTSTRQAHAVNEEPWDAPPGMSKLRCEDCRYWFAAPDAGVKRCPDCALALLRRPPVPTQ